MKELTMKFFKYFLLKSLVIIFVVLFVSLKGMENSPEQQICIADQNDRSFNALPCNIVCGGKVGIFGATPRYTRFVQYCIAALKHYQLALDMKRGNADHNAFGHIGRLPARFDMKLKDVFGKKINAELGNFICQTPL